MVLRPIFDSEPCTSQACLAAWIAVEQQQTAKARAWWLITQPDHAVLSGQIAAQFSDNGFPHPDPEVVHAIAMHDAGWNLFESDPKQPPALHPDGRPVSFFEVEPHNFLRAWTASVDSAESESKVGGYLVSQHFGWLGDYRLQRVNDPPDVRAQIADFLSQEQRRRQALARSADISRWDALLPLLQFCDLFSLYLCSGSRQEVEFPQEFGSGRIRAHFDNDVCVLAPSPFTSVWNADVQAHRYPLTSGKSASTKLCVAVK